MDEVKYSLNIPRELREELDDVAHLLRVDSKTIVLKGIAAALESIKKQRGEQFAKALDLLRSVRQEGQDPE